MSEPAENDDLPRRPSRRRRYLRRAAIGGVAAVAIAFGAAWYSRVDIADGLIRDTLEGYDLPATYEITSIGTRRQVIENVVIGDPANPDMTVERAEVSIRYRLGLPVIGEVRLVGARLYGRVVDGRVSFGTLDNVFYAEGTDEPFRLPDLRVAIDDARALIRSDNGDIGVKLQGEGPLRGGFSGVVGAVAPRFTSGDCVMTGASIYGAISIGREIPRLEGPLRIGAIDCGEGGPSLDQATFALDVKGTSAFDGLSGDAQVQTGQLIAAGQSVGGLSGDVTLSLGAEGLSTDLDLAATDASLGGISMARMGVDGVLRARDQFATLTFDGSFEGKGVRPGDGLNRQMAGYEDAANGTLLAPLLEKMRVALAQEGARSSLAGDINVRLAEDRRSITIPTARWEGTSGGTLLALERTRIAIAEDGTPRIAGYFETGGNGMPDLTGQIEQAPDGSGTMRLSLAEYRAGDASLAIPALTARQDVSGTITFSGNVRASGEIPGGRVAGLALPVAGAWRERSGLALWGECVTPTFDTLEVANLTLQKQSLMVCPPKGSAIVRMDSAGTRFAAGVPSVDLAGTLGDTPAAIRGGPIGLGVPGKLVARELDIALGPDATATRFHLSELDAEIGEDIAGTFADAEFRMADVPLDITRASGRWAWRDDGLTIEDAALRVTDRQVDARFQPMVAEGAALRFEDNAINADATLREETTGREIVEVEIVHDLSSGTGHADLDVPGITFDSQLQPDTVTRLALGTIANAEGTVTGEGRIDWNADTVASTGTFRTDSLDFAAAFGPVRGLSGTVEFTDLLGLVTAPGQQVRIAEINPGIVVNDGVVNFQIEPNMALQLNATRFPFMGGTLTMRPTRMNLGTVEVRSYVFDIEGLDAARFVERMELANLQASGTFDGSIPLIFDENGGRIEGGVLNSRPPGGNVSYVGALTYEDISPIANFAFDALKSLDYTAMRIGLDGSLEGEIVTKVKIDGVKQGEGAKRNIITRRLANLPIRFDVNVRAPFMQLLSSFKSLYDPAAVRDPRQLGLIDVDGNALVPSGEAVVGEDIIPDDQDIQPSESETMP